MRTSFLPTTIIQENRLHILLYNKESRDSCCW